MTAAVVIPFIGGPLCGANWEGDGEPWAYTLRDGTRPGVELTDEQRADAEAGCLYKLRQTADGLRMAYLWGTLRVGQRPPDDGGQHG